jgi:hypothetical protein
MAFDFNPITGNLDLVDSPAGYINGVVDDPTQLPVTLGTPPLDAVYLSKGASGLWLISRKPAGLYVRVANDGDADDWTYLGAFPEVNADGNWELYNSTDPTKELKFDLSGISASTTVTLTAPASSGTIALTQQSSDMEITDSTKGIILKSANNTRWRITINDDGTFSRAALALMTLLAFATSGMAQVRDMVTDTNGNIITGRTNTLAFTNNLRFAPLTNANAQTAIIGTNGALSAGSVPSGAAAAGSVLQGDGAGGSSFSTLTNFPALLVTNATGTMILRANASVGVRVSGLAAYLGGNEAVPQVGFGTLGWAEGSGGANSGSILFANGSGGSLGGARFGFDGTNYLGMRANANHVARQGVRFYGRFTNSTNYSRVVLEADTNGIARLFPEAAGPANTNNFLHISGLPTNDPAISGVLWNSNGAVMVSP